MHFDRLLEAVGGNRNARRRFATKKLKLTWSVPRWAYTRRLWLQMNHVLNPVTLIRMALVTLIVATGMIVGLKWAIPQIVLPNFGILLLAFPAILVIVVLQFGLLVLIPPTATIRPESIFVQHGQSALRIDAKTIIAAYLTVHAGDRIRLRICYTRNDKLKSRVIGVPPTVDLDRLTEFLPVALVVRDARNRFIGLSGPRIEAASAERRARVV